MMRILPALTALALPFASAAAQDVVYRQVPLYNAQQARLDTMGPVVTVAGRPDSLFARLRATYRELNVPTDVDDSVHGSLGTLRIVRNRIFAGVWLSRVVDCGASYTGSLADHADVELSVVSFLHPAGRDSTALRTAVVGTARPPGREPAPCRSRGYVEDLVRRRLESAGRH
jgi:hypothetical protein